MTVRRNIADCLLIFTSSRAEKGIFRSDDFIFYSISSGEYCGAWRKIRSTVKQEDAEKWEEIRDEILKDVNLPYFRYKIMAEEKCMHS